ncbi:GNAT family N-acetyltransferase [Aestuariibius sp. HNIBRBA575]|uniref:GNAT family N-acetyltransferase n=1 Tax=Aestuariibius sp. HNIBRBA575 TaxID=3233343 RepID=UPI0034A20AC2
MQIWIRKAEISDVDLIIALIDAAYAPYVARGVDLPAVSDGVADAIADDTVVVATTQDDVVGVMMLKLTDERAQLMNIAVSPDAGGQGVGKRLITRAETLAQFHGLDQLHLATHRDIPENIALYQHLGYEITAQSGAKVEMVKSGLQP